MDEKASVTKCLNCGTEFQGKFCPECGQRADTERFTIKWIFKNLLLAMLSSDGGIWITLKTLFTRPGQMMVDIINGQRKRFFSPFPMLFLSLSLYIVIFSFTGSKKAELEDTFFSTTEIEAAEEQDSDDTAEIENGLNEIWRWCVKAYNNNYTTIFIFTIPIYIFSARICFGKKNRKRYYRGEYCIPIIYSLILIVFYRCLTSIAFYFSPEFSGVMDDFNKWITIAAFTVCFKKMMGFSAFGTVLRSFLLYVVYTAIIVFFVIFGVMLAYFIVGSQLF